MVMKSHVLPDDTEGVGYMNDDESNSSELITELHKRVAVTLQLDADVINWFKTQGDESNHINKTLRTYMEIRTKQELKLTDIRKIKKLLNPKQLN
jgi:uncharacterized protein (DUF4415 family)